MVCHFSLEAQARTRSKGSVFMHEFQPYDTLFLVVAVVYRHTLRDRPTSKPSSASSLHMKKSSKLRVIWIKTWQRLLMLSTKCSYFVQDLWGTVCCTVSSFYCNSLGVKGRGTDLAHSTILITSVPLLPGWQESNLQMGGSRSMRTKPWRGTTGT